MEFKVKKGQEAPNFTLKNQNGQEVTLSNLRGKKKVLLSFHPLAWTGVCDIQMRSLEVKGAKFEELNTWVYGISVDSIPTKVAWAKDLGLEKLEILGDFWPHGGVAKQYGIFLEKMGVSARANVLLDEEGKIVWAKVYEMLEIPNIEEVIQVIEAL